LLKGDRSNCDGTFFLKVNRYKLSLCANTQKPSWQVDSFRKYAGYATAFVKHAGLVRGSFGRQWQYDCESVLLRLPHSFDRLANCINPGGID
jgi:hypothetical protein